MSPSVSVIIPSCYQSSRLAGKPLVLIAGKPMIQHVVERASASPLVRQVVVATDDERIADASGTQSDSLTSGRATPSTKEGTGGDGRFGAELDMGPEPDVSMVLFNRFGPTAMRKRLDLTVLLPPGPMKVSAVEIGRAHV